MENETPEEFEKRSVREFEERLSKLSFEDFFHIGEDIKEVEHEKFDPKTDEWQEVHWGKTPLGGDLSIMSYFDKNWNRCRKKDRVYAEIVIYTKEGRYVNSVTGTFSQR